MSLMKFAVIGFFLAFAVSNAEETRSSENQSQLTSSQNNKQQNKRLASYGSSSASSLSSYKPITGSYSSANPPLFTPSVSNIYSKASQHYNPFVTSSYKPQVYQLPLPGLFVQPNSYVNGANIFTSHPVTYGGQFHTQQVPFHQFTYNPIQPINPVIHTAPIASFSNSYQAPANSFYPGQQLHKFPIYHQQPQFYHVQTSFQPLNYNNQLKQFPISSSTSHRIVASKPLAFQSIIPPTQPSSTSQIEHDNHGSVSFTQISHLNEGKPSASPLIAATHPPQQVYYHQQPTPVYNGDYNKQFQYAAVPLRIAPNFYSSQGSNIPYANINRIQFSTPTAVSALIPSITTIPHKVSFP